MKGTYRNYRKYTALCFCGLDLVLVLITEALQDDFVIFIDASTKVIYQVDLSTEAFHAISMPSSVFARLRRMTFDPLHNYIYWTDLNGQSIWRMNVRDRTSESFISVETSKSWSSSVVYS